MKKQYHSYQQTIDIIDKYARQYPELISVQSIGQTWEGRPIVLATISRDVSTADTKPALLFTGTIHAREWIGNELAVKFLETVIENHEVNPHLIDTLTRNTIYLVPCLNPDGFEYSRTHFSFWRKNRRDNKDGTFGVDLNRNFGVRFKASNDTSLNTYGGPAAFSEPETAAIRDFVLAHKNITVALDYHSQGNVFFPAHKFNHESEIEGTDLNVLCANMNWEIHKVTGRKYGIHRGKPPANLIHGSGREYYYSLGILAVVVEVGTRNIPDYLANMSQSVDENVPAVLYALSEAINYSELAPKRPENFTISNIDVYNLSLTWEYEDTADVYFEIYRSENVKCACREDNLVTITQKRSFSDLQLKSGHRYWYTIRAVNKKTKIKSPFSPEVKVKTLLANDEFFRSIFPTKREIGYVGQYTQERNRDHFGYNSLFVGVNKRKGVCYGVVKFSMENLPERARIKSAKFSLYPMNRVNAKVENFGEWTVSVLDAELISDITDFEQINQAVPVQTFGQSIPSDKLTQGIWCEWTLNVAERNIIKNSIKNGELLLRIEGPQKLPLGADSQMMQFDIGFGKFGAGIHYRPNLDLIYGIPNEIVELKPTVLKTLTQAGVQADALQSGFDAKGNMVFGQMAFVFHGLPHPDHTVITEAYLVMRNKNAMKTPRDIRFTIEQAAQDDNDYNSVLSRQINELVGYEVSNGQLKERDEHHFIFDSHGKTVLEEYYERGQSLHFVIRATSYATEKDAVVDWFSPNSENECRLVIKYIQRRKKPLLPPSELDVNVENKRVKLTWKNPNDADLVGSFVVRNRFHPPKSSLDGVKLYAGPDEYTYDSFANPNVEKYYSVFTYDDVPNYSSPASVLYTNNEVITLEEEEYEVQDEDEIVNKQEEL